MSEVRGPGGTGRIDEAAARRAAEEAARKALEARGPGAVAAPGLAAAGPEVARDGGKVAADLETVAGPTGATPVPAMPRPPAGFENFKGFGPAAPLAVPRTASEVEALTARLATLDPSKLTADELGVLAQARAVRDPGLQRALDALAEKLLDMPGAADWKAVSANPAIGRLLAPLGKSADFGARNKLQSAAREWVDSALQARLAGKQRPEGAEEAMRGFREDMRALARETGMADVLQEASAFGLGRRREAIEAVANSGLKWYERAVNFVGDMLGSAADFAGDVFRGVTDVAGDAIEVVADAGAQAVRVGNQLAGTVVDVALDGAGKLADAALDGAGEVAAAGLDVLGAGEAARTVRRAADELGDVAARGFDAVGDVQKELMRRQGELVAGALELGGGAANRVLDASGAVTDGALDAVGAVAADGPRAAAEKLADQVLGPERLEFAGQVDGFTGLVTNRLARGESVFVRGEGGAEVGVGLFAGAKLTGGAVLGRDAKGMLTLTLEVGAEVEGGVRAKVGAEAGTSLAAVGAKAEIGASATIGAKGKLTLKFDPENPADVARLKALIEPTPAKLVGAAVNPLAVAEFGQGALADALANNFDSAEGAGSLGVKAGVKGKADLGPAATELNLGVDAGAGASRRYNRDGSTETTYFVRSGGKANVSATAGALAGAGAEAGIAAEAVLSVKVKRDAAGQIIGISGEDGGKATLGGGLLQKGKTEWELAEGERGVKERKTNVGAGRSTVQTVERELTPAGLAEAKRRLAGGEPLVAVFRDLNQRPGMYVEVRTTTEVDQLTAGVSFEIAAGASIGAKANLTIGKARTTSERGDGASALHQDLATGAAPFGGATLDMPGGN